MKPIIICVLLLVVVCSLAHADCMYGAGFSVDGATTGLHGGKCTLDGSPYATDGYDPGIDDVLDGISYQKPLYVAFYKATDVEGWNAADGFYLSDGRAALAPGRVNIEDIYVWAAAGAAPEDMILHQGGGGNAEGEVNYTLRLLSTPTGVTYTGPTEWTTGSSIRLPFYSTTNGLTGYHFQAEFEPVPEPASLLALFGGLASFGGIALKRIKK